MKEVWTLTTFLWRKNVHWKIHLYRITFGRGQEEYDEGGQEYFEPGGEEAHPHLRAGHTAALPVRNITKGLDIPRIGKNITVYQKALQPFQAFWYKFLNIRTDRLFYLFLIRCVPYPYCSKLRIIVNFHSKAFIYEILAIFVPY